VAILSSYAYRLQAFYPSVPSVRTPGGTQTLAYRAAPGSPPYYQNEVQYMCPPYKTVAKLGLRAYASDSFDRAEGMSTGLTSHGSRYNIVYGDGHVKTYMDTDESIVNWSAMQSDGTDNLTISSPSGEGVWHLFDNFEGMDKPAP
jgi:prepilin-type processing-associated H-X9-DG protein